MSRPAAIAILALVAACYGAESDRSSSHGSANREAPISARRPTDKAFAAMTADERCGATFERAAPCIDDVLAASIGQALDPGLGAQVGSAFERSAPASVREQRIIHRNLCAGTREYASALMACWDRVGCKALAACVYPAQPK